MDLEQLIKRKEELSNELEEINKAINNHNCEVYSGKLKKSIELLKEVSAYLSYPTIYTECEECGRDVEVDLEEVINELEKIYRTEFRKYD